MMINNDKDVQLLRKNFGMGFRHGIQSALFAIEQIKKDCSDDFKVLDYLEQILREKEDQCDQPNNFAENYLKLLSCVKRISDSGDVCCQKCIEDIAMNCLKEIGELK